MCLQLCELDDASVCTDTRDETGARLELAAKNSVGEAAREEVHSSVPGNQNGFADRRETRRWSPQAYLIILNTGSSSWQFFTFEWAENWAHWDGSEVWKYVIDTSLNWQLPLLNWPILQPIWPHSSMIIWPYVGHIDLQASNLNRK